MKKTFLYLFFVIVLINSVFALWNIDNSTFDPNTFQYQTYWTGNKFKLITTDANKINIITADSVSANICAVFDVNSFTYLSDNFTFSGNNCSITYNFLNDTEYIIGLYRSDSYAYNQYYISVATPFDTTNIKWYGYITNNIPDNWTFIDDYISDFGYMEINLSLPEIPPANITPNITQNQTTTINNFDVISESMNFGVFWIIVLFAWIFPFIILGIFRNKNLLDQGAVISMIIFSLMIVFLYSFKYVNTTLRFFTTIFLLFGIIFFALLINEEISITKKEN